jgi:hypothetical protein
MQGEFQASIIIVVRFANKYFHFLRSRPKHQLIMFNSPSIHQFKYVKMLLFFFLRRV